MHPPVERARLALGTLVSIRVDGLPLAAASVAISTAFAAVQDIHHRMSFHNPHSELSQLNQTAHQRPVPVSLETWKVLSLAHQLSLQTSGLFDVTVAPALTRTGLLPMPHHLEEPCGTWRDVRLSPDRSVFFERPLWIDLGGIGKGYAVDCAANALLQLGVPHAVINAGGDLRVVGSSFEPIVLRANRQSVAEAVPILELSDGSIASSSTSHAAGTHFDGRCRRALPPGTFVTVAAPSCMAADALTKVVLTDPAHSVPSLRRHQAHAYLQDMHGHWSYWA